MSGYKTYAGIIVAVLPSVLGLFGYSLAPDASPQIESLINELITVIGSAIALYGRAVAQSPGFLAK